MPKSLEDQRRDELALKVLRTPPHKQKQVARKSTDEPRRDVPEKQED
jgi:hypothetical protein